MTKERKRKLWILAGAALALCLAAGALVWRSYIRTGFPQWEPAKELAQPEKDSPWQMTAEFTGLEQKSRGSLAWDQVGLLLAGQNDGGLLSFYSDCILVDYNDWGKWRTIYTKDNFNGFFTGEPKPAELRFPSGLFHAAGDYRIRIAIWDRDREKLQEAGRCCFRVDAPTRPAEGKEENDFAVWSPANTEWDALNEHVTLTAKRIVGDEEEGPVLEMGLTNTQKYCASGAGTRVDYLLEGEWYTVSPSRFVPAYALQHTTEPGVEYIESQAICPEVLDHPGVYRLYWDGLGYCQFYSPGRSTEGAEENVYTVWKRADSENDRIDPDISLTFRRIVAEDPAWEEGHPPMLELELINQKSSFFYCPDCWRIDYLYAGEWYRADEPRDCHCVAAREETEPGLRYVRQRPIDCPEVLGRPGTYRLYWDGVGYCQFQVE